LRFGVPRNKATSSTAACPFSMRRARAYCKDLSPGGRQTSVRRHQDDPRRYDLGFTVPRHTTEYLDGRFSVHAPRNATLTGHRCLTLFSRYAQRKRVCCRSQARTTGTAYKAVPSACCCRRIESPTQQTTRRRWIQLSAASYVGWLLRARACPPSLPLSSSLLDGAKHPVDRGPLGPIARAYVAMQAMVPVSHVDRLRIPDYQAPITRFSARNLGRRLEER
jgi:hypothetical protein